jgi:hypothetical protein
MKESRTLFFYNPAIFGKKRIFAKVWKVQLKLSGNDHSKEIDANALPGTWSINKILN